MYKVNFPALFLKEEDSGYSVLFPDFSGFGSCGDDIHEATQNAKEFLDVCYTEHNGELPTPDPNKMVQLVKENADYEDMFVENIELEIKHTVTKRINVSLPEVILNKIDNFLGETKHKRSAFLAKAAEEYILNHS